MWIPDKVTYDNIQLLLQFVDFLQSLDVASERDRDVAEKIKFQIKNINNPSIRKSWSICLDIYDPGIQNGNGEDGIFWRNWSVNFESNYLDVTAESLHTSSDGEHFGDSFHYSSSIYFGPKTELQEVFVDNGILDFIRDAKNYKQYVTKTLNDVELDVHLYD